MAINVGIHYLPKREFAMTFFFERIVSLVFLKFPLLQGDAVLARFISRLLQ